MRTGAEQAGRRRVRALGLLLCALSLWVVAQSAYLRLSAADLGCADWPSCYGALLASEPQPLTLGVARVLHRIAATGSLLLAAYLVWHCRRHAALAAPARPATLLLLLMLALSALGIWSSDPRLTLVGWLNIAGGLGLVSFSWRIVLASQPAAPRAAEVSTSGLLRAGTAALTITVLLGAWLGAGYFAAACDTFPACSGRWLPSSEGWRALAPLTMLHAAPAAGDPAGATLHLLHRYAALATVLLLGSAAWRAVADPRRRRAAIAVLVLLLAEVVLGIAAIVNGVHLGLTIAHGTCAAALLAAVASLLHHARRR